MNTLKKKSTSFFYWLEMDSSYSMYRIGEMAIEMRARQAKKIASNIKHGRPYRPTTMVRFYDSRWKRSDLRLRDHSFLSSLFEIASGQHRQVAYGSDDLREYLYRVLT